MLNATTALVDEFKQAKGVPSDYALAKLLNVRQQTVSNYRSGRTQMSDEIALRVAEALGRPAAAVLAQLAAERAKNPEVAKVWKDAVKVLSRGALRGTRGR